MTTVVEHDYAPRGTARQVMECRDGEVLVAGPAGTGKSRGCIEKLHTMCLLNPGMRALMIRKTAVSLTSSGLVTYQKHVAAEAIAAGVVKYFGGSSKEPPAWKYANGSVLVVGGLNDPLKIMSTEYDVIYIQEATEVTKEDWESCTTRLRNGVVSFQQLLADCNPDSETHWLYLRCQQGQTRMLESRHWENPTYFHEDGTPTDRGRDYVLGKLANLTGVRRARLYEGRWVSAEGVVYEQFDRSVHLLERFDIPETWRRWWTVDFGYTNPFVLQCWAEDPDGRIYLYREIYHTQRLVEDHARDILLTVTKVVGDVPDREVLTAKDIREDVAAKRRVWIEPKPRAVICDHDAEDRATLERHLGMSTTAANKKVKGGIELVQSRLKLAGDGRPRLYLLKNSVVERDVELDDKLQPCSTEEELPSYIWDTKGGVKPKEQPVKEKDHGMDAKRYIVAELDAEGRPRVRFMGR
ncbi:phage terminase large subunit [Actinosynnema sp. NPDC023587]|uniref:phage terminase large subunit n=1 Tax=Actinosynnema sp. NPDC023587 TaxID=3154695 RepID=UPI0033CA9B4F